MNQRFAFLPYSKQGNAYAYIPFTSFHGLHTFQGWVLVESLRLLAHSSMPPSLWREEGSTFYHHLCSRGYQQSLLSTVFQEVNGH